jgi:hypothetical protein
LEIKSLQEEKYSLKLELKNEKESFDNFKTKVMIIINENEKI